MANVMLGEMTVTLLDIEYTLRLTTNVIMQYQGRTNSDLIADAYVLLDAINRAPNPANDPVKYAMIMTGAVSMTKTAWLIYLAAKEANGQVEFGEIQEALILDHDVVNESKFYPAIFGNIAFFALNGANNKKKDNLGNG